MRESAVVRLVGDQLYWYPPGRGDDPISLADSEQQSQLQEILRARQSPVLFAVPGTEVRLQELSVSANEKRHIAKSLPFLLEEEFASDIEDLHIASAPLRADSLAVASCAHHCLGDWRVLLEELSGINQWVPEPLLLPWRVGEISLVIEAGRVVARSGECEGFAVESELLSAMLAALPESDISSIILYGQDQQQELALIPESLRARVQWRRGGFSAALLLSEDVGKPLNLLQGEYAAQLPLKRWWKLWRWPLVGLGVAFVLQLLATYADYSQLQSENLRLRQSMESAYRQAVPRGAIADPERQLQRKLNDLRGGGVTAAFVTLLEQVGNVVQAERRAQINTINFSGRSGELRLNLVVPDFKAVERIRSSLNAAGLKATVESSNSQGDEVRARMKVQGGRS